MNLNIVQTNAWNYYRFYCTYTWKKLNRNRIGKGKIICKGKKKYLLFRIIIWNKYLKKKNPSIFFFSLNCCVRRKSAELSWQMETMNRKWYEMNVDILIDNLNSIHYYIYRYVDLVVAIVLSSVLFFVFPFKIHTNRTRIDDNNLRTLTDNK